MQAAAKGLGSGHRRLGLGQLSAQSAVARRDGAFTLIEIMLVVFVLSLLVGIAIPAYAHIRSASQMRTCINNLRQLDGAKSQWALEHGKNDNSVPVDMEIEPYLKGNRMPQCPAQGR